MPRRILVVDDNADVALMLQQLLELEGHEVRVAADGELALSMAFSLVPELVLLDIGMPGMDGCEVAAQLRANPLTRDIKIVAVSGYGTDADRLRSAAAGIDRHYVKPLNYAQLPELVEGICREPPARTCEKRVGTASTASPR